MSWPYSPDATLGLSCSTTRGDFPNQRSNPCPLRWQEDQTLDHQGSPWNSLAVMELFLLVVDSNLQKLLHSSTPNSSVYTNYSSYWHMAAAGKMKSRAPDVTEACVKGPDWQDKQVIPLSISNLSDFIEESESVCHTVVAYSLWLHGLQPARLLWPQNSPVPFPGDLLDPGIEPEFPLIGGRFFTIWTFKGSSCI